MRLATLLLIVPVVGVVFAAHAAQPTDSCLASCNAGSEDDRATCRLGCNQQSAPRPATPPPSATPPPTPSATRTATPTPTTQPTYVAPPRPQSTATCESSCNNEPVDDRSTCRLMCAQQSRPTAALPTNGGYQPSSAQAYYPPTPPTYNYPPQYTAQPQPQPTHAYPSSQPTPTYAYPPSQPTPTYAYPPSQPQPHSTPQPQPQPTYAYPQPQPQPTYAYPPSQPQPQSTPPQQSPQPTTKSLQEIATCQSACTTGSTTDRATCRLTCAAQTTVVTPPTSYNVVWGAPPQNDAAARAAVIRQSNNVATPTPTYQPQPAPTYQPQPTPTPPTPAPPPAYNPARTQQCASTAQSCIVTCSETIVPCSQACDKARMSSTDRATCKLTCDGEADVCNDTCRAREKSCNAAP